MVQQKRLYFVDRPQKYLEFSNLPNLSVRVPFGSLRSPALKKVPVRPLCEKYEDVNFRSNELKRDLRTAYFLHLPTDRAEIFCGKTKSNSIGGVFHRIARFLLDPKIWTVNPGRKV